MADPALIPADEEARLAAVRRYDILDTPPDGAFERVTALAARLFDVPIAIVSIVDSSRIWFKSHHGLDVEQIDRAPGLCASAILQDRPWLVSDARNDPRALANPLVAGDFGLQFYAGVPLRTADGHNLGTLCVIDRQPREVTPDEVANLSDLAAVVMDEMELRLSARRTVALEGEMRQRAEQVAASLQESLVPPALPDLPGLEAVGRYHVAQRDVAGGDFYDLAPTDRGAALIVGDACGKGPLAASSAATARWTLRTILENEPDPARALVRLNSALRRAAGEGSRYVTAVAIDIRPGPHGADVAVAVGGHPLPLILRTGGEVQPVGVTGPILGWFEDCAYVPAGDRLRPGDALIAFTDGLVESVVGPGGSDDGPLLQMLAGLAGRPLAEIAAHLDAAMADDRRDDAAFVIVSPR